MVRSRHEERAGTPCWSTRRQRIPAECAAACGLVDALLPFTGCGISCDTGPREVSRAASPISDRAVAAVSAYCEYVHARCNHSPTIINPFRSVLGFQVGRIDEGIYERHYR